MLTPATIVTIEQAGALAAKAAMRLGVPVSVWTGADPTDQQAAIDVATEELFSVPGLQIAGRESDSTVQLACVVQALHRLDLVGDGNAQEHRRLQDQGVTDVQAGRNRLSFGRRAPTLCGAACDLLRSYRGAVNMG